MLSDTTTDDAEVLAFVHYFTISLNKAPKTATNYAHDIRRFASFIAPTSTSLVDATTQHIESWRDSLLTEGRNKPQSVCRKIAALAAFYKWAKKKRKLRPDNPSEDVEKPKVGKSLPKVMSEAEVQCLLAARVSHDKRYATFLDPRDKAIMETLYGSGLRRFEVCGLDLLDVDLMTRKIRVRHGKGDKERYSYLSDPAIEAIQAYLEVRAKRANGNSGSALFISAIDGSRISPRQVWAVFDKIRKAAKAAGLEKHVVPHTLRHSFATHIYRRSRNIRAVQKLLGHSSINTTERYTHIEDDELREIYEASHPRALCAKRLTFHAEHD